MSLDHLFVFWLATTMSCEQKGAQEHGWHKKWAMVLRATFNSDKIIYSLTQVLSLLKSGLYWTYCADGLAAFTMIAVCIAFLLNLALDWKYESQSSSVDVWQDWVEWKLQVLCQPKMGGERLGKEEDLSPAQNKNVVDL